jgi:hypothetical protein
MWHEVPSMNSRLNYNPPTEINYYGNCMGFIRRAECETANEYKEIGRFFGFLKFFCVFSGSFGVLFFSLMHLFSEPAKSHAIRQEVTV